MSAPPPFLEPIATEAWFSSQPRFWLNEQGISDLFAQPSLHLPADMSLNNNRLVTELVYFAMQLVGLLVACRRGDWGVWLGMAALGAQMEFLGVAVTHSHKQSMMMVQVMPFLPLKELLWYPMTQYPCYLLASTVNFAGGGKWRTVAGRALCCALVHSLQVIQYESIAYRTGVDFLKSNPAFPLANGEDTIGGGPWMNIYGNFAIATTASAMAFSVAPSYRQVKTLLLLATCGLATVSVLGFYPVNALKLAGCAVEGVLAPPSNCWPKHSITNWFDLNTYVDVYSRMVQRSPVWENLVVKLAMLMAAWFVFRYRVVEGASGAAPRLGRIEVAFVWASVLGYHALMGWNALRFDAGLQSSRSEAVSIYVACLAAALALCDVLLPLFPVGHSAVAKPTTTNTVVDVVDTKKKL